MEEEVLDFIHRRFKSQSSWNLNNSFWFAEILFLRFLPNEADIWFDEATELFYTEIDHKNYYYGGVYKPSSSVIAMEEMDKDKLEEFMR